MSNSLIEKLQTNLGYVPLQKIDPNTHVEKETSKPIDPLGQAVVPAACVVLYKSSRSHENAESLQRGNISTGWAKEFFGDIYSDLTANIAAYANVGEDVAVTALDSAFDEAVRIVRKEVGEDKDGTAFRNYLTNQRSDILLYLPASMHMGESMQDSTLDDRTNKMEGPVSSFMHTIEKLFSGSDSDTDHKIATD